MKVAIIGTRGFNDYVALKTRMAVFESKYGKVTSIVTTDCSEMGPDKLLRDHAEDHGIPVEVVENSWEKDKNEGLIRSVDWLLLVWDGESKGSRHSLHIALENKKPVFALMYKTE